MTQIGDYRLLLPIGVGGMGTVYLGRREIVSGVERDFAIKVLHPALRDTEGLAEQLLREARLAARVQHPNVVQMIESGQHAGGFYLVMEYVHGETLAALIRASIRASEPIPLPIVARILSDALTGLMAAHEARDDEGNPACIVHRDFSPQNLLVGLDGRTRLSDFGIAKALDRAGATATGVVKGKVGYMAPEHALGKQVAPTCDVWAAGVVLWEAIAGRRLFHGANDAQTILRIVSGAPIPRASSHRPEVTAAIDETLAAALITEPRLRIADARELKQRVEAAWQEHGIAEADEVARWVGRHAGEPLRERRQQIALLLAEVRSSRDTAAPAPRAADDSTLPVFASPRSERSAPGSTTADLPGPGRTRRGRAVAGGAALLLVGAAAALSFRPGPAQEAAANPEEKADAVAEVATEPSGAPPAETATPEAAPAPDNRAPPVLRITANAPIQQLRVGRRSIAVPDPVAEIEVPLSEEEQDRGFELMAVARGGRRSTATIEAGQRTAALEFGAAPARATPRRPRSGGAPASDRLADSPYGGR